MDRELQAPEGYCPRCEYPINPGTCPECGATVTSETLSKSPASVRRRKIRRRFYVIVPLLFFAALAMFLYHTVNWIAIAPTGVLLSFQESYRDPVGQELFGRFLAGSLSQVQTQELLDHYVDDPFIEGLSKYPADVPFKISIQCRVKLPGGQWSTALEDWQLAVDGEQVDSSDMWLLQSEETDEAARQWIWCPPLSEGRRHITMDGVATLKVITPSGVSEVLHRRRVHLSRDFEVAGKFVDYIQPENSPELAERIGQTVAAVAFIDPDFSEKTVIAILYGRPEVPVAGTVLVRVPGAAEGFTPLREVLLIGGGAKLFYLDPKLHLDRAGSLDVLINPDPVVAFHNGVQRYLGGAIRWRRLPIRSDVHVRIPLALNRASIPPTRIVLSESSRKSESDAALRFSHDAALLRVRPVR